MSTEKQTNASLNKLMKAKAKAMSFNQQALVEIGSLTDGQALPAVCRPCTDEVDLINWIKENQQRIETLLSQRGAILFRGFPIASLTTFERFVNALSPALLDYSERSTPRSEVKTHIYTSTEYPADRSIPLHNEMSYSHNWPMKIWFYCAKPAQQGGETPIVDSREVYTQLDPKMREQFHQKKVMYVRNYGEGIDLPWQEAFQTTERETVEHYCRSAGIRVEWKRDGGLRTQQVRDAVLAHPQTGELLWFNQVQLFHISTLEPGVRASLLEVFGEENLPRNVYYGDGTSIEDSVVEAIREVYQQLTVRFPWQEGDILMLDNMLVAHGRAPFTGPRQVLVAMADLFTGTIYPDL
ncbi:MAG TPA: TauD/TfdA family dioxygenase [Ktedonobacteraceae bacterium]|nr:TauD/TfdA family dioxygenase [Ktedonobacteraceae bacterium]